MIDDMDRINIEYCNGSFMLNVAVEMVVRLSLQIQPRLKIQQKVTF